jgi:hypothetical protein
MPVTMNPMRAAFFVLVAALALGVSGGARAQGYENGEGWSVEWVLPGCLQVIQGSRQDHRSGVCIGVVMAVLDMRSVSATSLRLPTMPLAERQRLARESICVPHTATDLDGIQVAVAYARRIMADGTLGRPSSQMFSALVYRALQQAWPCQVPVE